MEKIFIITGPTGVGKSDFAEKLAAIISGEIVNADVGQFYAPLTIGTAKPAWKKHPIPHHLFDVIDSPGNLSNAAYRVLAQRTIADIHQRGKRAIIVGGSGFYIQSLLFDFPALLQTHKKENLPPGPFTWQDLYRIDPDRAQKITPHDTYRIQRALEIYYGYGVRPSTLSMKYDPVYPYTLIHTDRSTNDLYHRINERTAIMLAQGWIEEVASLPEPWKEFVRIKKIIGYDTILQYLEGTIPSQGVLEESIQQKTRNYAKRQRTFFRSLKRKIPSAHAGCIREFDLTLSPVDLYIKQLLAER